MKFVVLIGRILFASIFVISGPNHFSEQMVGYAQANGVPLASIAVPLSGVIALLGGLFIMIGFKTKIGGWLIVIFLVPVTFMMHKFWILEGQEAMLQRVMFFKNISMLGGALLIAYFGAGTLSIDSMKKLD